MVPDLYAVICVYQKANRAPYREDTGLTDSTLRSIRMEIETSPLGTDILVEEIGGYTSRMVFWNLTNLSCLTSWSDDSKYRFLQQRNKRP